MGVMWEVREPVTVRAVVERLQQSREIAYTTVMTVMDNLHSKGFLTRGRAGRAYVYQAARPREEHEAELMEEVLAGSADRSATLLHFVEKITPDELAQLRALLADKP